MAARKHGLPRFNARLITEAQVEGENFEGLRLILNNS